MKILPGLVNCPFQALDLGRANKDKEGLVVVLSHFALKTELMEASQEQLQLAGSLFRVYKVSDHTVSVVSRRSKQDPTRIREVVADDVVHMVVATHGLVQRGGSHCKRVTVISTREHVCDSHEEDLFREGWLRKKGRR